MGQQLPKIQTPKPVPSCVAPGGTPWSSALFRSELLQHRDLLVAANKDVNTENGNLIVCGEPRLALKLLLLNK